MASPCAAAGVFSSTLEKYGEATATYQVGQGPGSVIVARTLADGRLVLTDRSAPIVLGSSHNQLGCRLRGRHTAVCRAPYGLANITIEGGPHNDVIDARSLLASSVRLAGGAGNDTLLAPKRVPDPSARTELTGGPGRNVIIGGPNSVVSYMDARGPVTVDLARGFGAAPGDHDRIVGVESVRGSTRSYNFLSGAISGGQIWGGAAGNRIIAHSGRTEVTMPAPGGPRVPSVIACVGPAVVVSLEPADVVTDRCRVEAVKLQEPMRSATAPAMTVQAPYGGERRVVVTAGSAVVSEVDARPPPRVVPVRLNGLGRELLTRSRHLWVLVSEFSLWPGQSPRLQSRFTTVIDLGASRR
jgi:hypothetical protein